MFFSGFSVFFQGFFKLRVFSNIYSMAFLSTDTGGVWVWGEDFGCWRGVWVLEEGYWPWADIGTERGGREYACQVGGWGKDGLGSHV